MSDKNLDRPTPVLGGTGKTGRRVVSRLQDRSLPVRIGSRRAAVPFDWEDPATWVPAVAGARAAYISYYPDLALPGAVEAVGSFARVAVENDVRRLVLLAGRGEPEAEQAERAVIASGADVTVVRATWFAQNFSPARLLRVRLAHRGDRRLGARPRPGLIARPVGHRGVGRLLRSKQGDRLTGSRSGECPMVHVRHAHRAWTPPSAPPSTLSR